MDNRDDADAGAEVLGRPRSRALVLCGDMLAQCAVAFVEKLPRWFHSSIPSVKEGRSRLVIDFRPHGPTRRTIWEREP
jgi:hypothetical protein